MSLWSGGRLARRTGEDARPPSTSCSASHDHGLVARTLLLGELGVQSEIQLKYVDTRLSEQA